MNNIEYQCNCTDTILKLHTGQKWEHASPQQPWREDANLMLHHQPVIVVMAIYLRCYPYTFST